jgi:nicotinamidase-related amidase
MTANSAYPTAHALLVIDMQNAFCDPAGSMVRLGRSLEGLDEAIRQTAAAIQLARFQQVPVIYTRQAFSPGYRDAGVNLRRLSAGLNEMGGLLRGSWDVEVIPALQPQADDLVIDKTRFDAFLDTPLLGILRDLGVGDVVVTGILTNICVESTVRGAVMRDFHATILADCCAGLTQHLHDISLEALATHQLATITTIDDGFTFESRDVVDAVAGR